LLTEDGHDLHGIGFNFFGQRLTVFANTASGLSLFCCRQCVIYCYSLRHRTAAGGQGRFAIDHDDHPPKRWRCVPAHPGTVGENGQCLDGRYDLAGTIDSEMLALADLLEITGRKHIDEKRSIATRQWANMK
jgi:hypothetical protein